MSELDEMPMPPRGAMQENAMPTELPASDPTEQAVPLKFLSQPDDTEAMQTPAEGDTVTMQVDGVISRIEGETAFIKPLSINGNPIEDEAGEATGEGTKPEYDEEAEEAALRTQT